MRKPVKKENGMIVRSKPAASTALFVPNDEAGRKFLDELRRRVNRGAYRVRLRGRHPNRKQLAKEITKAANGNQPYWNGTHMSLRQSVPANHAAYFAVYLDALGQQKRDEETRQYYISRLYEANAQNLEYIRLIEKKNNDLDNRAWEAVRLLAERDSLREQLESTKAELALRRSVWLNPTWETIWFTVKRFIINWWRS